MSSSRVRFESSPLLLADPCFLEHETGDHPESPERLRYMYAWLEGRPVLQKYTLGDITPATRDQLQRVHAPGYVERIAQFAARGGGHIDSDTVVSRKSFEVACRAAGAATSAVDAVLTGQHNSALCLARPPGHHALRDTAMGFCLFNNVAVAACHALQAHHLERVLIVDWDVHHGNGTQDLFYDSEQVGFFSAHRFPFYPGSGTTEETGTGAGLGTKFNLPVRFGTSRAEYLDRFASVLADAATRLRPQLVLLSAGFDSHRADPIGSLGLETEDFEPLTKLVRQVADQYCQGRVVSLLEGGYNVRVLAECVECHMHALLPDAPA